MTATTPEPGNDTLGMYLEEWLQLQETQLQPSTWLSYRGTVARYLAPALADTRLDELAPAQLNRLYVELLAKGGQGGRALSLRTVRYAHAVLHKALEDARKVGLVEANVTENATLPRYDPRAADGGRRAVTTWSAEELRAFLDFAADDPLRWLWTVAAGTGMRRGELLGLSWSDVDLDRRQLRVRHSLSVVRRTMRLKAPKNGKTRTLLFDSHVAEAFERRFDEQQQARRRSGPTWSNAWDLVFTTDSGHPLIPDVVTRAFRRLVAAAPVPSLRLHGLRHVHATLMLEAGVPVKVVSERLGHATVSFTMDIYAHVLPTTAMPSTSSPPTCIRRPTRRNRDDRWPH